MTKANRWLDELPTDSAEHGLLVAGKSARPPVGALEADWQALSVALAAAAAATSVSATSAAAVGSKAASSAVATKAVASGVAVYAKSVAIGFAFGVGVLGAHALVQQVTHSKTERPTAAVEHATPAARRPVSDKGGAPRAPEQPQDVTATPATPTLDPTAEAVALPSPALASKPAASQPAAEALPQAPRAPLPSLAARARELAQVKRLLDAGASSEALRQLEASSAEDANSALSEERDALHVQALDKSHRRTEAQALARQFLVRYPKSPHVEKMRQLVAPQ